MIADEITLLEEWVRLELIQGLAKGVDVDALEGFGEGRAQVDTLKDRLTHVLSVIAQAMRDTREVIRRSTKLSRVIHQELKDATKDSERMRVIAILAAGLSEEIAHDVRLELSRVIKAARMHADHKLRTEIVTYETQKQASADSRHRTKARGKETGRKPDSRKPH